MLAVTGGRITYLGGGGVQTEKIQHMFYVCGCLMFNHLHPRRMRNNTLVVWNRQNQSLSRILSWCPRWTSPFILQDSCISNRYLAYLARSCKITVGNRLKWHQIPPPHCLDTPPPQVYYAHRRLEKLISPICYIYNSTGSMICGRTTTIRDVVPPYSRLIRGVCLTRGVTHWARKGKSSILSLPFTVDLLFFLALICSTNL